MENKMFSLTYCYDGANAPFACTLAVSNDKEKLKKYMMTCVEEDCRKPDSEEDEWNDDCNYSIWREFDDEVYLHHNANTNLYATYKINTVEVL